MHFIIGGIFIPDISNITNELLLVGSIYKKPELFIEYGQYIKSKYDFFDEATRFFYDSAEILFQTRSQIFNRTTVSTFMAEDTDRLTTYKKYGGWKTIDEWMKLAVVDDFKGYYEVLKKFSLLREYDRNGYNVERIMKHKKFETFTASDIYRLVRGKVDKIQTVILNNDESEVLNSEVSTLVDECMEVPDMGLKMPYPILNDLFRGLKTTSMMAVGMLSNAGKTRFMCKLIAYTTLVLREKTLVLLNEMTVKSMRYALLTTVINNPEFQHLHGVHITKPEREITLGLYKDKNGEFIYRKRNKTGDFLETAAEYIERVRQNSEEYRQIKEIANWIETETQGLIYTKDISSAYDDQTLEFEIRKAALVQGVKYFFYDTLKQGTNMMGEWSALKATATKLSELTRSLDVYIYCSIQLTDDANEIEADGLTSSYIANAKQIKHVLDTLVLFKEIPKTKFGKYQYLAEYSDWGEPVLHKLDPDKRYGIGVVDKNRFGDKKKIMFEFNLDLNIWTEIGEAFKAIKTSKE
nr:MAG TPA: replicative helicase [Caudoviricetes sp.]